MEPLILITIFASFIFTYLSMPIWIKKAKQIGLVWEDMHKPNSQAKIPGSGGAVVVLGFVLGILMYIALQIFYFDSSEKTVEIFSLIASILLVSGVALIDDLLGWQRGGLSRKSRIILVGFSAIPLMVINAGTSSMTVPFIGSFEFGILYPLLIIPIGIIGATTTFNILAGYNGLESSQGILILIALAITTYLTGNPWLSIIAIYGVAVLLAFYIFNFHPARVFPGDVMTYFVGALIAIIAILGNIEKIAVIFFMPYIIQTVLKLRGGLVKASFGKVNEQGGLEVPYKKIYALEHLAILVLKKIKKGRQVKERDVVYLLNFLQVIFIVIGLCTL